MYVWTRKQWLKYVLGIATYFSTPLTIKLCAYTNRYISNLQYYKFIYYKFTLPFLMQIILQQDNFVSHWLQLKRVFLWDTVILFLQSRSCQRTLANDHFNWIFPQSLQTLISRKTFGQSLKEMPNWKQYAIKDGTTSSKNGCK